jgi:hypothetical protein
MFDGDLTTLLSVPAVVAAVEAFKMAGMPHKMAGIVSIIIGAAFGLSVEFTMAGLIGGFVIGLGASGLYSATKATIQGMRGL